MAPGKSHKSLGCWCWQLTLTKPRSHTAGRKADIITLLFEQGCATCAHTYTHRVYLYRHMWSTCCSKKKVDRQVIKLLVATAGVWCTCFARWGRPAASTAAVPAVSTYTTTIYAARSRWRWYRPFIPIQLHAFSSWQILSMKKLTWQVKQTNKQTNHAQFIQQQSPLVDKNCTSETWTMWP